MKAKNNLDLFRNEIIHELTKGGYIYDVMMNIYLRESGNETRCIEHMLKWYADVPRETLELSKEIYDFLKAYNDEVMCGQYSIDNYVSTCLLIDIGIIPKKYATYKVSDLIKIIKVKKESNK